MQLRSCALLVLLLGGTLHLTADALYSVTDLGTLGGSGSSATVSTTSGRSRARLQLLLARDMRFSTATVK